MRKKLKYRIGIGVNYWDDPHGLVRILNSEAYDICEVVYVIDGKYKGREDKEEYQKHMDLFIRMWDKIHYVKMRNSII